MSNKAVIIGGGIAGMVLSKSLSNIGYSVQVFDKSINENPGGFLTLWPNAVKALRGIHAEKSILEKCVRKTSSLILNREGRKIAQVPLEKMEEVLGIPVYSISRKNLIQTLARDSNSTDIQYGAECRGLEFTHNRRLEVEFDNQRRIDADLLIGADGINSFIRASLFGKDKPVYAGRISFNGVCRAGDVHLVQSMVYEIQGRGKRIGFSKISDDEIGWYANVNYPENQPHPSDTHEFLMQTYKGWPMNAESLFQNTPLEDIKVYSIQYKRPLRRWSKERITLAGDAAHPMTPDAGQGACQAMEDAYVLGECLKKYPVTEALEKYEKLRIPRTSKLVDYSRNLGFFSNLSNSLLVSLREMLFKTADPGALIEPFIKIAGYEFPDV